MATEVRRLALNITARPGNLIIETDPEDAYQGFGLEIANDLAGDARPWVVRSTKVYDPNAPRGGPYASLEEAMEYAGAWLGLRLRDCALTAYRSL